MGRRTLPLAVSLTTTALAAAAEPVDDARIAWIDSNGAAIRPDTGALGIWRPEEPAAGPERADGRFRLAVSGVHGAERAVLVLRSMTPGAIAAHDTLIVERLEPLGDGRLATPWLVLVADADDRASPVLAGRALRVVLGDRVEARVRLGLARPLRSSLPVGRPPGENGPLSRRKLGIHMVMVRSRPGGSPLAGGDEDGARRILRHQIAVLSEVLAQCAIEVDRGDRARLDVADPPGPSLLAVGGRLGLPSAGGEIRLRVDALPIGPVSVEAGLSPFETAFRIARAIEQRGFEAEISSNAPLPGAAGGTADVLVRRRDGALASLSAWPARPLSTDPAQPLEVGEVLLDDGLDVFEDREAASGTLEERTLAKALADRDPTTVDVIVAGPFLGRSKQGESFVRSSRSSLADLVLLDPRALGRARQSYTLAHEIGHVLLDDLGHSDDRGENSPSRLMSSVASSAVDGPKRLTATECERMRKAAATLLE